MVGSPCTKASSHVRLDHWEGSTKIKMDRKSILRDTVDYMELLEMDPVWRNNIRCGYGGATSSDVENDLNPNMMVATNPRLRWSGKEGHKQVKICCTAKPDMLLSMVNTPETLGLGFR